MILLDKRILSVLGIFILIIAFSPAFQPTNTPATSEITNYQLSTPTVEAAYRGYYVASIHSHVYHKATCRYVKKIKPYNKIYFKTKAQARAHGYRPCKICRP